MRYRPGVILGIKEPLDGFTPEEKELEKLLSELTMEQIYAKFPTSRMKFIVAAHFELGYSQELVAKMLRVTQATINEEISLVRGVLMNKPYRPQKKKEIIKVEDLFKLMLSLRQA